MVVNLAVRFEDEKITAHVFLPSDPPKNTLLPKELLWRFTQYSNGLQVILTGRVGIV